MTTNKTERDSVARHVYISLGPEGTAAGTKTALSSASAATAAIAANWVDIVTDVDAYILISTAPVAVRDTSYKVKANLPYRIPITSGAKIAGITALGASGNIWVHAVS